MTEPAHRVEDLLQRIARTAQARYKASERFARHHRLAMWTLAYLALALVFIPLIQTLDIPTGIGTAYLHATQSMLAILVLVYALLVGMEKYAMQAGAMRRGAIALERLARKLGSRDRLRISDAEYNLFSKEYFDIIERYDSHQPLDDLLIRLNRKPGSSGEWPQHLGLWLRAQLLLALNYLHYLAVLALVACVFVTLLTGIGRAVHAPEPQVQQPAGMQDSPAARRTEPPAPKSKKPQ